jgi:hypothetical protein
MGSWSAEPGYPGFRERWIETRTIVQGRGGSGRVNDRGDRRTGGRPAMCAGCDRLAAAQPRVVVALGAKPGRGHMGVAAESSRIITFSILSRYVRDMCDDSGWETTRAT